MEFNYPLGLLAYDRTTIFLHWATAVLFAMLWLVGQTADFIPDGPLNTAVWSCHVVFGFALAALLVFRVFHRATRGRRLPAADTGLLHVAAKVTHYGLYALLAVVVALGIANAFVRGYNLFDIVNLPQIGDKNLKHPITEWHGFVANVALAVVGVHAAAALIHRYFWRDNVLARMLPAANRSTDAPARSNYKTS